MAANDYTKFKGVTHIGDDTIMTTLENNLKSYYDWALLSIGGWTEADVPQSGAYGGDFSSVTLVEDPLYTDGQVWQGVRKDWVYESGVDYADATGLVHNPQSVGVPITGGNPAVGSYHVNYPLGRIIFDAAIPITTVVQVAHSWRDVQVYRADDAPWFQELQFRSMRPDDSHFSDSDRGEWAKGGHQRVQLPAIVIECVPRRISEGYELGNEEVWVKQDVIFHVVAETRHMRNKLVDFCAGQFDKSIWLFDTIRIADSGDYPLDFRGELVGPKVYPDLVDQRVNGGHRWKKCTFTNTVTSEVRSLHHNLYEGIVRTTCEVEPNSLV